ncbi:MAG: carboxypeptidase regulatory-like domain-containing protein, partial [Candidatus Diapherotrites archaeon]|nr:carboxypeptidase regulatory-like domain-containing protein [Candidatus Diapherotrites archaeon]
MGLSDLIPDQVYDFYDSASDHIRDCYESADEFCWNLLDSVEDKGVPVASLWENVNISPVAIPIVFLVILAFLAFPMIAPSSQNTFSAMVLINDIGDYSDFEAKMMLESDQGKVFSKDIVFPEKKVEFDNLLKGSYSVDVQKDEKSICPTYSSSKNLVVEEDGSFLVFKLSSCLDEAVESGLDLESGLVIDSVKGTVKVSVYNSMNSDVIEGASIELKDYETKTVIASEITDSSGRVEFKAESDKKLYVFVSKEGFVDRSTNSFKVKAGSTETKTVSITPVEAAEKGRFKVCVKAGTTVAKQAEVIVFNEEDREIAQDKTANNGCVTFGEIPASTRVYSNVVGYSDYSDYRIKKLVRIFSGGLSDQEIVLFKGVPLRIKVLAAGEVVTGDVKVTLWSSLDEKIRGFESDGSLSVLSLPWTESIMLKPNFKYKVKVTGVPSKFKDFESKVYSMNFDGVDLPISLNFVVPPENLIIQDVRPNHTVALGKDFVLSAKVFAGTNPVKNAVVKYKIGNSSSVKSMVFDNDLLAYKVKIDAPLTDESLLFTIKAEWDLLGEHLVAEKIFTVMVSVNPEQKLSLIFYFGSEDEEHNGTNYTRKVPKGSDAGPVKVKVIKTLTSDGKSYGKILGPNDGVKVFASSVQFDFSNKKLTKYSKSEQVFVLNDLDVPSNPEFNFYVVDLRAVQTDDGDSAVGSALFKIKPVKSTSGELVFANVFASPMVVKPGEEVKLEAIVKWANSATSEATVEVTASSFSSESTNMKMDFKSQTGRYELTLTAPSEEGTYPIELDALLVYSAKEYEAAFNNLSIVVSENPEQVLRVAIENEDGDYGFIPLELTKPVD